MLQSFPGPRRRLYRATARVTRTARRQTGVVVVATAAMVVVLLGVWAARAAAAPIAAVLLGTGGSAAGEVAARAAGDGDWKDCTYSRVAGTFGCGAAGTVAAATANVIGDRGWTNPYLTPAIMVSSGLPGAEFRIRVSRRLAGTYAAAVVGKGAAAELRIPGRPPVTLTRLPADVTFEASDGPTDLELTLSMTGGGPFGVVVVRRSALR